MSNQLSRTTLKLSLAILLTALLAIFAGGAVGQQRRASTNATNATNAYSQQSNESATSVFAPRAISSPTENGPGPKRSSANTSAIIRTKRTSTPRFTGSPIRNTSSRNTTTSARR